MLGFLDPANALTLAGLIAAVGCALLALSGEPALAVVALLAAGLCDLFDGPIARRLERQDHQRRFGGQLDSLVDACAFGFAPAVLLFALGLRWPAEVAILLFFAACAIWRLAYFNTVELASPVRSRRSAGLPTAYVAWIVPAVCLAAHLEVAAFHLVADLVVLVVAVAMVTSSLQVPKPRGRWYAVLVLAGLAMACAHLILGDP